MQFFVYFDSVLDSQEKKRKKNKRLVKIVMWRRKKAKIVGQALAPFILQQTHIALAMAASCNII